MANVETEELLQQLKIEHRDLDEVVDILIDTNHRDKDKIQRFKKRKLQIRDQIEKLEREIHLS